MVELSQQDPSSPFMSIYLIFTIYASLLMLMLLILTQADLDAEPDPGPNPGDADVVSPSRNTRSCSR